MGDRPLWSLSASELSAAYANGLSPREVVETTIAHIRNLNPQFNAIVTLDEAGAVRSAEDSARRWKDGCPASPLDGVPVTIKDNILVAGLRATWGSRLYSEFVPDTDEAPARRMREAGAVILGKTNVPELTLHGFTDNLVFGTTGNPWNPKLTPGGSSGGARASPPAWARSRSERMAADRFAGPPRIPGLPGSNPRETRCRAATVFPPFCIISKSSDRWRAASATSS
jgi:aspartyl-tRNA(Asn)/glutamyl-tRNA(Gln) amidotransferase subunit A